jgi:hypothetical protein
MLKKMREGRPRAVRLQPPRLAKLGVLVLWVGVSASGCATEENTGEPPDVIAGSGGSNDAGQPSGGKAGTAGSSGSSGKATGGMAGSGISAFGGTSTSGGSTSGGSAMGGSATGGSATGGSAMGGSGGAKGGSSSGGAAGSAGAKNGGAAGMGGSATGGSATGGSATGGSATGGSGGGLACLDGWQGGTCDTCSTQTQSDKLACVDILNCYKANSCGPATCSNNDDKCGVNKIGKGTAGYPIAKDVYDCACK